MDILGKSVNIAGLRLGLDSSGDLCFVSHAHSDHTGNLRKSRVFGSEETLLVAGLKKNSVPLEDVRKYLEGTRIELLNAGHIYGAKQLYLENSASLLFTGDVKLRDNLAVKGCELREAENLIIECTYGKKEYLFPDPFEVYDQLKSRIAQENADITVLMGYSTGKAQELIMFVNEYLGEAPIVDKNVAIKSKLFKQLGMRIDFLEVNSPEGQELMKKGRYTVITSPSKVFKTQFKEAMRRISRSSLVVFATGWALGRNLSSFCDVAVPLSDHCDFNELNEIVERVNPKKVFCRYGFSHEFAQHLRRKGYTAVDLESVRY